ncbi:MAG: hypothetical protein MK106_11605 [Mariniblastus sp.]|nr:hypothetical protein [Mariniblastus sp.]
MNVTKIILMLITLFTGVGFYPSNPLPCKYSVRDVAFVNIHRDPWRLQIIKPNSATAAQFEQWNAQVKRALDRTNIHYLWVDEGGPEASVIHATNPQGREKPPFAASLTSSTGDQIALQIPVDELSETLSGIVESPLRNQILDDLSESLCGVLLIQSGRQAADASARTAAQEAIDSIKKQMWSYEKAPDQGPGLYELKVSDRKQESWLIRSLGLQAESMNEPKIVLLYGQGVVLGGIMTASEQLEERLVARASICGRNCECDLDQQWLYGQQILHRWTLANERAAETSLDFDPHSTLVQAEVTQIIQKGASLGNPVGQEPQPRLGSGLVIHELDHLDPLVTPAEPTASAVPEIKQSARGTPSTETPLPPVADATPATQGTQGSIPWGLLLGMILILLVFIVFLGNRLTPGAGRPTS